jgi:hypothetical protein
MNTTASVVGDSSGFSTTETVSPGAPADQVAQSVQSGLSGGGVSVGQTSPADVSVPAVQGVPAGAAGSVVQGVQPGAGSQTGSAGSYSQDAVELYPTTLDAWAGFHFFNFNFNPKAHP